MRVWSIALFSSTKLFVVFIGIVYWKCLHEISAVLLGWLYLGF